VHNVHEYTDFLCRALSPAITIGCGFRGGEIVPSFFVGATFGCVMGGLMGLDPGFAAALGMVCFFCGVVNCPLTSLFLSIELFGAHGILLFTIGCAVSYMLSGYYSLYNEQKIMVLQAPPSLCQSLHQPGDKDQGTGIPGRPYKDQGGRLRRH